MINDLHLNTKQLAYSAVQAIYMMIVALIAASLAYVTNQVGGQGFVAALLVAAGPALFRVYKGWEDGVRAIEGDVLPRDVGSDLPPIPKDGN
jgi:hypothetical protein